MTRRSSSGLTIAIIQARMGSTRLPGKVLLDIAGQSMLERVVQRVRRAKLIDDVVVATTTNPEDDSIAEAAARMGVLTTRGSETDVLDRYHETAALLDCRNCVRVSADSPFVDPGVCDIAVDTYRATGADYASNKLQPTFPLGLDVEVFSRDALERAWLGASESFERSHVTVHMYRNPDLFTLAPVTTEPDRHTWRWTVDDADDMKFARAAFEALGGGNDFTWLDVVNLVEREPGIAALNAHVQPRPLVEG